MKDCNVIVPMIAAVRALNVSGDPGAYWEARR